MKFNLVPLKRAGELIEIEFVNYCRWKMPDLPEKEIQKRTQQFHELLQGYLSFKYSSKFSTDYTFSKYAKVCFQDLNYKFETKVEYLKALNYIFKECFDWDETIYTTSVDSFGKAFPYVTSSLSFVISLIVFLIILL